MKRPKELAVEAWERLVLAYAAYRENPSLRLALVLIRAFATILLWLVRLWLHFH